VHTDKDKSETEFTSQICAVMTPTNVIFRHCQTKGILDVIFWVHMERSSYDIGLIENKFKYEEGMGLKECLGFFEGQVLPNLTERLIVVKHPAQDKVECTAFFKVLFRNV